MPHAPGTLSEEEMTKVFECLGSVENCIRNTLVFGSDRTLLGPELPGIATRSKDTTNGAPGLTTRNKKLY